MIRTTMGIEIALMEAREKMQRLEELVKEQEEAQKDVAPLFYTDLPDGTYFVFLGPGNAYPKTPFVRVRTTDGYISLYQNKSQRVFSSDYPNDADLGIEVMTCDLNGNIVDPSTITH